MFLNNNSTESNKTNKEIIFKSHKKDKENKRKNPPKKRKLKNIDKKNKNIDEKDVSNNVLIPNINVNEKENNLSKNEINDSKNKKMIKGIKGFMISNNNNTLISLEELKEYLTDSFDEMDYEEALIEDKRSFCQIYKDILINNHTLLNIIFEGDQYKPRVLKFIIYVLSINLYFVINGLFYSESYIDELYHLDEKEETYFSFIQRSIKRTLYSSFVGVIVNFLISYIIVDGNKLKFILFKRANDLIVMKGESSKFLFNLERSINVFYIINYFIMIISWYYISCFNNVYPYTKIEWIKSSIFIIIVNHILPFIYSIAITLIRTFSLRCKSEKFYKISSMIN